jgi:type IV pilus assembly protein PilA
MGIGTKVSGGEDGFTLIELLVVLLILGVLAAIALPAFFDQTSKASDAKAKEIVHTTQVAMEACSTDNDGVYSKTRCKLANLRAIEPTIPPAGEGLEVKPENPSGGYTIKMIADSGNTFSIIRSEAGELTYPCTVSSTANRGGCPGTKKTGAWGP